MVHTDGQAQKNTDTQFPTRERILAAAFQLFLQHGYEGTSLNQIASASGVSKGAFYHYFASKSQIYREVIEGFFLTPFEQFDTAKIAKLSPKKARARLQNYYTALPEIFTSNTNQDMAQYFALLFDSLSRLPDFKKNIRAIYAKLLQALAKSFANAKPLKKRNKREAQHFLASLEGEVYLNAILKKPTRKTDV